MRDCAASGDYNNAGEVVREALRLLRRVEEKRNLETERLKRVIREGDEAIASGKFTVLKSADALYQRSLIKTHTSISAVRLT